MGQSKGRKVKALGMNRGEETDIFWMSLEEAKRAIADKYEFLVEMHEKPKPKKKVA